MENLKEMDKFLELYIFPKLNLEEVENMNRSTINKKIETVILEHPKNKSPDPDSNNFSNTYNLCNRNSSKISKKW